MFRRDAFAGGFSAALGAASLALLAFLGYRFFDAALAISTPFVAGLVIALMLDPLVDRIQKHVRFVRGRRFPSVLLVFGLFLLLFGALITLIVPMLIGQAQALVHWFAPSTYTIDRALAPEGPFVRVASGVTETRFTSRGLVNGTNYYFRVGAVDQDGLSIPVAFAPVSVTPTATESNAAPSPSPSPQPSPLPSIGALGMLQAQPSDGQVRLFWAAPVSARSGFDQLRARIDQWLSTHQKIGPLTLPRSLESITAQYSDQLAGVLQNSARRIAEVIVGSVSGLLSTILIPIITFYLIADLDRLRARLIFLLPDRVRAPFVHTVRDVGEVFGGYLRGMMSVCLAYMGASTVLMVGIGIVFRPLLSYSLLIGIAGGLLYAVPYVGFLGVAALAAIVAIVSGSGIGAIVACIVGLFLLNQFFDNVVTPKVVGGGVGLHPILSMFALLLGASLFGLWGMLLAVPAAGSIQVVLFRLFPKLAAPTSLGFVDRSVARPAAERTGDDEAH